MAQPLKHPQSESVITWTLVSDDVLYTVNFAAELLCLRDQYYILTNDVVLIKQGRSE